MSYVKIKYHTIAQTTDKAYLLTFNIESRRDKFFAYCFSLGNSMTYPMYNSTQLRDKHSHLFRTEYSELTNLYESTKLVNFNVWLPKSQVTFEDNNIAVIPLWLMTKIGSQVFCSKKQTAPKEYAIYPYHCDISFAHAASAFFITEIVKSSSYEDDPWMSNGIENHEFSKLLDDCTRRSLSVLNHFKLDERFVIVETNDTFAKYHTIDLDKKCTIGQCANEFDIQMLITLAYKHDGLNSQFPYYAARMLNIELK